MKITANMIVLNEEDYVGYALESVYNSVDKIVITEGCAKISREFANAEGLSTDKTTEIIKTFPDPEDKISYHPYGFCENMSDLRNNSLKETDRDTDYILVVDGDTLFRYSEIMNLRLLVEKYPNIRTIFIEHLMFFWDLHHILTVGERYKIDTNYYSPLFFWRYKPELMYSTGQMLCIEQGGMYPEYDYYWQKVPKITFKELEAGKHGGKEVILKDPQFSLFHFGWVRPKKRLDTHIYQRIKGAIIRETGRCQNVNLLEKQANMLNAMRDCSYEEIIEWVECYHKIYTGIFDSRYDEHIEEYKGAYPEIITKHPWWNFTKKDFGLEALGAQ